MLNHEVPTMLKLETEVDGLVDQKSNSNKNELMRNSGRFYRELKSFYEEGTWQAQVVKMLINLTDGTMRNTNFAKEQLGILFNMLQPGEIQNAGAQISVLEPHKLEYGWQNLNQSNVEGETPLVLASREPKYFDEIARTSYLKKLLGLNSVVFEKSAENLSPEKNLTIDRSAIVVQSLVKLLLKTESGGDKNQYKNELYEVARGFNVMTEGNINIIENSDLARWLTDEVRGGMVGLENQRPLDLASKILDKLFVTYHKFQNIFPAENSNQQQRVVVHPNDPYIGLIHTGEGVSLLEVYDIGLERPEQRDRHYFLEMDVAEWENSVLNEDDLSPDIIARIINTARDGKLMVSVDEQGNYRSLQNILRNDVSTLQDMIIGIVVLESRQINGAIKLEKMGKILDYQLPE